MAPRMTTPIVALDVADTAAALAIVETLDAQCRCYKIGLELFTAEGPQVVRAVRDRGADVFLDLKLHDIPNTVQGAVARAAGLGARLLTVHASGGRAMLAAAQAAAAGTDCRLLGVTVLTSLDREAVAASWGRDVAGLDVTAEVLRLAETVQGAGLHGVVCSGHEAGAVRERFGDGLATLVPGVRLPGTSAHDQARVVTPAGAARAGARYVVVGRTVTAAGDPREAMRRVLSELASS
ncbi:MAG: orotidine-5'-phosphate decarboxylase [Gemmatimonadota bacterium]|nr:orotidine-5'-phosphate decarboxylase [Gemmatimonadota bacterium]MDE3173606.1 orotidine-5'-phosphate decarboxylase [Gemmatimonadota bacterium]MDE3216596.1 orotidine-5'-phosphate decarboxylase [Gemmatimonadota bacterium]